MLSVEVTFDAASTKFLNDYYAKHMEHPRWDDHHDRAQFIKRLGQLWEMQRPTQHIKNYIADYLFTRTQRNYYAILAHYKRNVLRIDIFLKAPVGRPRKGYKHDRSSSDKTK